MFEAPRIEDSDSDEEDEETHLNVEEEEVEEEQQVAACSRVPIIAWLCFDKRLSCYPWYFYTL